VLTPDSASPTYDPYEPRPSFVQRHANAIAAVVVFALTIFLAVGSFPPFKAPEFAYAMLVPGIFWAYRRPPFKLYAVTLLAAQAVAWTILLGWLHNVTWLGLFLLGPFVGVWIGTWYLAAWWSLPRIIGEKQITGGLALIPVKKLKGARFLVPSGLSVETKAIGRGTIMPVISL